VCRSVCAVQGFSIPARSGATDDVREDCRLKATAGEPGEDWGIRRGCSTDGELMQLVRKRPGERLSARLAALAVSDEQRRAVAFEREIAPVEGDELCASQAGRNEREQDETVALCQATDPSRRNSRRSEQSPELLARQPRCLLARLHWTVEI
jgi:hypothetical protein